MNLNKSKDSPLGKNDALMINPERQDTKEHPTPIQKKQIVNKSLLMIPLGIQNFHCALIQ